MIQDHLGARGAIGLPQPGASSEEARRKGLMIPLRALLAKRGGWHLPFLASIALLATFLDFYRLGATGDGNLYYAAAVKSMLESWHNFFFVSFDPGGFVTVDKPPVDFWLQTASAALLGFRGFSLMLPQALAGVGSVLVLYHLVQRAFGRVAGLIAALALAVTPISVATNRNNTMDSLLAFVVLLAAWAVVRATETGRLRWLIVGGALLGLGFEIKMLEAYLVVPALALLYLLAAPPRWPVRLTHLALAGAVMLAISLAWPAAVDATPASLRPYVGSSTDNSEIELIIGHNGLQRLLSFGRGGFGGFAGFGGQASFGGGGRFPAPTTPRGANPGGANPGSALRGTQPNGGGNLFAQFGFGIGQRGPQRFISQQLAGQISWLLPVAFLGLIVAAWQAHRKSRRSRRVQGLLLFGTWLVVEVAFFSVAAEFQPYYLVVLAPAIAALVGIGAVALWRAYRLGGWQRWLLPATLIGLAGFQMTILRTAPDWSKWLWVPVVVGCVVAGVVLGVRGQGSGARERGTGLTRSRGGGGEGYGKDRINPEIFSLRAFLSAASAAPREMTSPARWLGAVALAAGLLLLAAPTAWAAMPVFAGDASRPIAGPSVTVDHRNAGGLLETTPSADPKLLAFLEGNQGSAKYLVAMVNATEASPLILDTGKPVMAMGGFMGSDPILSPADVSKLVQNGTVRFFLLSGGGFQRSAATGWVTGHCTVVPPAKWQSTSVPAGNGAGYFGFGGFGRGSGGNQLYDCAGVGG